MPKIAQVDNMFPELKPFELLYNDSNLDINSNINLVILNKLGAYAKKRESLMNNNSLYELMCKANIKE